MFYDVYAHVSPKKRTEKTTPNIFYSRYYYYCFYKQRRVINIVIFVFQLRPVIETLWTTSIGIITITTEPPPRDLRRAAILARV